ncbi:NUDIX hydrolase [Arenibacter certesii]|uniref:Nudix hydrolase domain-containing protein n=1 Tax=Arenibacter certesii TaxID=228955 RepID=A0A918J3D8_9FLAO|nr:NUDIX domain-containing protein [Arenibacter certesii]GGW45773.1 hypothetical protein GCM10007383_32580 [Arenibacter certesii]
MDEFVDILDCEGKRTGESCLKSEAHKNGYWHPCVHVWLYTKDGDLLIQKRTATKETFPNAWDVSVAGHVRAGESFLEAAQREVLEEIGLNIQINDLKFIGNYATDIIHNQSLIDREYHHVYIVKLIKPIEELSLQAEEVSQLKLISISILKEVLICDIDEFQFVPYGLDYFDMVFNAI